MNDFLPEGHTVPDLGTSGYMKFKDGDNKIRVLGSAIVGYELWVEGKPLRRKVKNFSVGELEKADINKFTGKQKEPTYFWAFPVWNYQEGKVQILEITQASVINGIENYLSDDDWGSPFEYDLVIVRESEPKVSYSVKAKPHKKLDEAIMKEYQKLSIDVSRLYEGENPFNAGEHVSPDEIPESVK